MNAKAIHIGRTLLYPSAVVHLWRHWLYCRWGWIALGLLPSDEPLVPEDGKVPWWVESGEYDEDCPVCGKLAVTGPNPDDPRVWCEEHGVQEFPNA
jgi:hypothetical protein